jgi:hypothetical protein
MVSRVFKIANNLDNDKTMVVKGQTFVRQTVVDVAEVFIANPNDGKFIKSALCDIQPMLLVTCVGGRRTYYEDAIVTTNDPHKYICGEGEVPYVTSGNDVAVYVLDRNKPVARPARDDFNARRQEVIAENEARGIKTYIPQAQKAQGGAVVSMFKRPEMTNG